MNSIEDLLGQQVVAAPTVTLHAGDNRESLRRLIDQGVRVHSVVTDPPYGLVSVQKRFGKPGSAAARTEGNDGSFARLSGGFMGKAWDGTGIERDPEFWKLIHNILLPGGYCFAFSGSRTGHWQACAMEMAGFIMHPMHGWVFGSGFPKAHAADKAIDKIFGAAGGFEPNGAPVKRMIPGADQHRDGSWIKDNEREYQPGSYIPSTPEAAQWEGWAYGTQAQKPALEPIYLGQRPFDEKTGAANLLKHGVGAVNIDGCRVPFAGAEDEQESKAKNQHGDFGSGPRTNEVYGKFTKDRENYSPSGRHPANLILDGSDDVVAMFPDSSGGHHPKKRGVGGIGNDGHGGQDGLVERYDAASGSAARFFHHFPPDADPIVYHAKAGKVDRAGGKHPTVKPVGLIEYLVRHVTPPGGIVLDPFAGSGTTAEAARRQGLDCILMEAEPEYVDFLRGRFEIPVKTEVATLPSREVLISDLL